MMTNENCLRVLAAGAGLKVKHLPQAYLIELAVAAQEHDVHLEIKGALPLDAMLAIAEAGGGNITFDISD